MPKGAKELGPLQVKRLNRTGVHAVGGGAWSWRHRRRGNLDMVLPAPTKLTAGQNYAALQLEDAVRWFATLRARSGTSARALEFQTLTASRTGAVRFAAWDEINLERDLWTIQPRRQSSKIPPSGGPHRVPLTAAMITLLEALPREQGNSLVFWSSRGGALSDAALAAVMRKLHVADQTAGERGLPWSAHAHRRTFATVAMEAGVLEEIVGRLLNHTPISITGQRYARPSLDALRPSMDIACVELNKRLQKR